MRRPTAVELPSADSGLYELGEDLVGKPQVASGFLTNVDFEQVERPLTNDEMAAAVATARGDTRMNLLTPAQRRRHFPLASRRYAVRAYLLSRWWRLHHWLGFSGACTRWFVRCRCGRRAEVYVSSNVGRPNVEKRWLCPQHHAEWREREDRLGESPRVLGRLDRGLFAGSE